jgi:hypothetical protein
LSGSMFIFDLKRIGIWVRMVDGMVGGGSVERTTIRVVIRPVRLVVFRRGI